MNYMIIKKSCHSNCRNADARHDFRHRYGLVGWAHIMNEIA
jgi:hypothetical protein